MESSTMDHDFDAIRQTQTLDDSVLSSPDRSEQVAKGGFGDAVAPSLSDRKRPPKGNRKNRSRTPRYAASLRTPVGVLAIFDDGSVRDAEIVRLRGNSHVIGRDDGDLTFPHEVLMSSRHGEIQLRREDHDYVWHYIDLKSRNGSFFRVGKAALTHGQEFLVGRHRLKFMLALTDGPSHDGVASHEDSQDLDKTQLVTSKPATPQRPQLIIRSLEGDEVIHTLDRDHIVVGSDASTCSVVLEDDPYACPNHTRIQFVDNGWL
ncbi:MAG: FHA domain-containing protein, partial [Planctomycetota bacterium]